ncbi:MAG: secondary thiamine-phosphate synthase enzyme YjbQ [Candidatus Omnitrophica bacterium]|nr:secondary thiamine-phosphate synthase enzyme YjbQ [Candidatus Omnitrophota bacterium]MDD5042429.1 secondary thiamine-phosphate synthase enzyme YjbQ [Candidatus Omnitrophota bacterium]MDD5500808.1 secondary thiamine-phosphate synthase enzyme YjbQ [Candidatus Omnitrophota bacterium]
MKVITRKINLKTKGDPDLINITGELSQAVASSGMAEGNVTVFVVGSTAAITTFEYEPGLVSDVREFFARLIPQNKGYAHDDTWGDANGFSHLRASLQGPSLVVPFTGGKLLLGVWQQVVLAEFDNRPRQREVVFQIIGD